MPKDIITTVYEYHELPTETAKAAAREWLQEAVTDHGWWDKHLSGRERRGA